MQRLKTYQGLGFFLFYPLILIPLPALWLNILCTVSFWFSVLAFMLAANERRQTLRWFPAALELSALCRLCLYAPIARLILGQPTPPNDWLLQPLSEFLAQDSPVGLLVGFGMFAGLQLVVIPGGVSRISEVAARFAPDSLPSRHMAIEQKFTLAEITRPEADRLQEELQLATKRLDRLKDAARFMVLEARIGIAITALILVLGSALALFSQGASPAVAFPENLKLAIAANVICVTPMLILIVATLNLMREAVSE